MSGAEGRERASLTGRLLRALAVPAVWLALRAFPAGFREAHGADLLQLYRDRLGGALTERGARAAVWLTARNLLDVIASGLRERAQRRRGPDGAGRGSRRRPPLLDDIAYGLRSLRRRPGFAAAAALPVALAIGASTAVFSVVDGVVLRPLPYPDADRLVTVGTVAPNGDQSGISPANFADIEGELSTLDALAGVMPVTLVLTRDGLPERVDAGRVSPGFFDLFGARPYLGRLFDRDDFEGAAVLVLGWDTWVGAWGADPEIVGRSVELDGRAHTVVGVLPRDFVPPEALQMSERGYWLPLDYTDRDWASTRAFGFLEAAGRLSGPVAFRDRGGIGRLLPLRRTPLGPAEAASAELREVSARLADAYPDANRTRDGETRVIDVRPMHTETIGDVGSRLALLLAAVGLLLAIACANVTNLLLASVSERAREMALRIALGARGARLAAQLVTESLVVSLAGGAAGLLLAYLGVDAIVAMAPEIPRLGTVTVDLRIVGFALALSTLTGLVFGVLPARIAARNDPRPLLIGGADPVGRERFRGALVVGQTALALVLATVAGLFLNSFVRLASVDPGFATEDVALVRVRMGSAARTEDERRAFYRALRAELAVLPGVLEVSGSVFLPIGGLLRQDILLEGGGAPVTTRAHTVLPGYFDALDIPVLEGRALEETDDESAPPVVVVSRSFARQMWPDGGVLGRTFERVGGPAAVPLTVVGVVGDVRQRGLDAPLEPVMYEPYAQRPWLSSVGMLVRYAPDVPDLAGGVRRAVAAVDPTLPLEEFTTLEARIADSIVQPRFYALILSLFSLVAVAIAGFGVYATMTYSVQRRFREIGVRVAIGAGRGEVLGLIVRRGSAKAALGVAIGMLIAFAGTRFLEGFLFSVRAADPVTFLSVGAVLLGVSVLACAAPAWRASRVDVVEVLRGE